MSLVCNGIEFLHALHSVDHKSGSKTVCFHASVSQKENTQIEIVRYVTRLIGAKNKLLELILQSVCQGII
jgi:hypothetical protein